MPTPVFDDYHYRGEKLESYSFYNYIKTISRIKYIARQRNDILFDKRHLNPLSKVQRLLTSQEYDTLIGLVGPLSTNEKAEDVIRRGHLETDIR